mgnify:CR=1 FL=1|tara:strand:+ start:228 stop:1274 length:1047 start_codon:yes stop_codon:yes gene_type:complete
MKLAIIALSTFGYFERMSARLTERGLPTTFFDERPKNDVWSKLKYRLLPKRIGQQLARDHTRAICERIVAEDYTHVLVFYLEVISQADIEYLKSHGLHVCRYTWDSVRNRPSVQRFDHLMEAIGSFDPGDCRDHGYTYIPLYSETIDAPNVLPTEQRSLDLYFCGTMHSSRPALIHDIEEIAKRRGWSIKLSLFFHSRLLYAIKNLTNRKAMRMYSQIVDTSFPHAQTLADSQAARVVIDINHPGQVGLTMRTFEALAQGAILSTTNAGAKALLENEFPGRVEPLDFNDLEGSLERALALRPAPLTDSQFYSLSQNRFIEQILNLIGIDPAVLTDGRRPTQTIPATQA